ncbi:hypothetical protein [Agrococcus citreus]|uniref:Uncharacterized protein n=1 Tax=Agrococcus citreus TaxID=84643 RepID=A0ABN1YM12_9MICO
MSGFEAWLATQGRWLPGDALRVVVALSVPLAGVVAGGPSAAAMLLTLGGAMALRFVGVGTLLDIGGQLVLLASAWFAVTGAYQSVTGLDVAAHLASGAVLALLVRRLLLRLDLLPSQGGRRAAVSRVLHTVNAVVLLGLLWELGEWAGNAWFSPEIGVGYEDTLVDLAADGLGALAAALLAERSSARDRLPAGSRSR